MAAAARLLVALRWPIVVFWVAAAVWVTLTLPTIREAQVGALGDLVPNDAEALDAELRSKELFAFPLLSRTLLVQRNPEGLPAAEQARVLERARALSQGSYPRLERIAGALPVTNTLGKPPFSRERSTTAISYLFFRPEVGRDDRIVLGRRLARERVGSEGFVGLTGAVPARARQAELVAEALPKVELATLALVALVVGLHFRALGAPLLTLGSVAAAYLTSSRLIAWAGERLGISVPSEVEPVIVVLLFGVITDYAIFFLAAVRERLDDGQPKHDAVRAAAARLLPIVLTAGLTVAGASAALAVAELGFFQAFGPGMAMSLLIGLAVAITLIPAGLAIGGRLVFWPARPRGGGDRARGPLARLSTATLGFVSRRPHVAAAGCAAVLLVGASGLLTLDLGNPLIRGLPADARERQAYAAAAQGFAPGILSPTVVVVAEPEVGDRRRALVRLQRLLSRQPGVAQVVGPADQPLASRFGAAIARNGDAARFFVVLRRDPLGGAAVDDLRRLRRRLPTLLAAAGLPRAQGSIAGDTALVAETIDKSRSDLGRIAPAVLAVIFVILAVFLRALLAPLYLVGASVLALLASLGLATYLLAEVQGYGDMTYFVPVAAAVLLVSLGSDYNVFLAGRIWQEARRRPLAEAVVRAGAEAARPIAVAGVVLAASFALLALVPLRSFRELALTMGLGLLIDAFLVRSVLVPALILIVGERSGWPGKRLRQVVADSAR